MFLWRLHVLPGRSAGAALPLGVRFLTAATDTDGHILDYVHVRKEGVRLKEIPNPSLAGRDIYLSLAVE
jgi:hypothetical protein